MAYWTLFRNDDGADDDFASLPHSVVSLIVMCGVRPTALLECPTDAERGGRRVSTHLGGVFEYM